MKRPRTPPPPKLGRDASRLARLAEALTESGSQLEDSYWEQRLAALVDSLMHKQQDEALESALDHLWTANPPACDELARVVEAQTECYREAAADALFIAIPVLAWSRYAIPAGAIPGARLADLRAQLHGHVLAAGARLALADALLSPDQLPRGFTATRALGRELAALAAQEQDLHLDPAQLAQTTPFVSDTRYVLGAVRVPKGAALFRWQEDGNSRAAVQQVWEAQGGAVIHTLLPACNARVLLPNAYFSSWREVDKQGRPYSLRAAVDYLGAVLNLLPHELRAVAAPFYDRALEEYRIGFTALNSNDVLHGVVWPLIGSEDDSTDVAGEIEGVLAASGVGEVLILDTRMPMEFCEECGAPLFPNPEGEPVHAEMPETDTPAQHLH